jgi:hypothetical protein
MLGNLILSSNKIIKIQEHINILQTEYDQLQKQKEDI